jgi:lactam utilization protein B
MAIDLDADLGEGFGRWDVATSTTLEALAGAI